MKILSLCFFLVVSLSNFSFAQQQGNLKILNHEQVSDTTIRNNPQLAEVAREGLNVPGWRFVRPPKPDDQTFESGKIIFEIIVSNKGNVIDCKTKESTVSPKLTDLYKNAVLLSKLKRTNPEFKPEAGASGTITFIIHTR